MSSKASRAALLALLGVILFLFYYLSTYDDFYPKSVENVLDIISQHPLKTVTTKPSSTSTSLELELSTTTPLGLSLSSTTSVVESILPASEVKLDKTLVVARLKEQKTQWVTKELPDVRSVIYTVDDSSATYTVPRNKGNEAMVYLTYIIDHYDNLTDVSIFTHSDRITWHNNDLSDSDLVKMIGRLDLEFVKKLGYINLRCHQDPGCPDHIHLDQTIPDGNRPEEMVFKTVWSDLHPLQPMPKTISHPCCAQFAVSKETIHKYPRDRYVTWREWLLNTKLENSVSGRIWEYTWHFIWTGQNSLCPAMHLCYCEAYSICFKSYADSDDFWKARDDRREIEQEFNKWKETVEGKEDEETRRKAEGYEAKLKAMEEDLSTRRDEAYARGEDSWEKRKALGYEDDAG